jgi:hypothetical protein
VIIIRPKLPCRVTYTDEVGNKHTKLILPNYIYARNEEYFLKCYDFENDIYIEIPMRQVTQWEIIP